MNYRHCTRRAFISRSGNVTSRPRAGVRPSFFGFAGSRAGFALHTIPHDTTTPVSLSVCPPAFQRRPTKDIGYTTAMLVVHTRPHTPDGNRNLSRMERRNRIGTYTTQLTCFLISSSRLIVLGPLDDTMVVVALQSTRAVPFFMSTAVVTGNDGTAPSPSYVG